MFHAKKQTMKSQVHVLKLVHESRENHGLIGLHVVYGSHLINPKGVINGTWTVDQSSSIGGVKP